MSTWIRLHLASVILVQATLPLSAGAAEGADACEEGEQESGALYLICMPVVRPWNGDLVLYAHGYVAYNVSIELPELELPNGISLPKVVNGLGYAFATTSYSANGLAVLEGIADVTDLITIFQDTHGEPDQVYLVGVSEGGIITTLAVEQAPQIFDGGLAACGPIGDFRRQINYWGDFRVVFDAFFPGVIPGRAVEIPQEVIDNWETVYSPSVEEAIQLDKVATAQLLNVSAAPIDPEKPTTTTETVLGLLWYNVFATNDGIGKLGGQPFGNRLRIYDGSLNDLQLNRQVERFRADQGPADEIEAHYQTSGDLVSPLVTLHTTGDPIIPYSHEPSYTKKVIEHNDLPLYAHVRVARYGHCNFKLSELLVAFGLLVWKVTGGALEHVEAVLPDEASRQEFFQLANVYGLPY